VTPVPHRHWTFSIPRVLRGLIERDRKLLGLLSQTAHAAILKTFQAFFDRADVRPGCVISVLRFTAANDPVLARVSVPRNGLGKLATI
jgi:hypothetical protein